jgi:competence protein ComEC
VIIYLSIISVILFNVSIDISKTIAYLTKIIINTIYFVLEKISDFSFSYIEIENPNFYFVIIYYILIFLYMFYKELKVIKNMLKKWAIHIH